MEFLQPPKWPRAKGFSYGISAAGRMVFISGMIGADANGKLASDFLGQVRQALKNIVAVLAEAKATPAHIVRMTWYLTDKREYLAAQKELGQLYREIIGPHYPAMTAIQVAALVEDAARVEIEVTAVIP